MAYEKDLIRSFYGTKEVATMLGIRPQTISTAIWNNRIEPPQKSPSGQYLWTIDDIQRLSWALLHKGYTPKENP